MQNANGKSRPHSHPELSQSELRRVAVAGDCDPRTIIAYLAKEAMRSTTIARVERGLCACGYGRLVRQGSHLAQ